MIDSNNSAVSNFEAPREKEKVQARKLATDDAYLIIPDSHQLHHSIKSRNPIIHVFPFVMMIRHNFFLFVKNVWDKFVT